MKLHDRSQISTYMSWCQLQRCWFKHVDKIKNIVNGSMIGNSKFQKCSCKGTQKLQKKIEIFSAPRTLRSNWIPISTFYITFGVPPKCDRAVALEILPNPNSSIPCQASSERNKLKWTYPDCRNEVKFFAKFLLKILDSSHDY